MTDIAEEPEATLESMSIGPNGTVLSSYSVVDEEGSAERDPIIFPDVVELSIYEHDSEPDVKYLGLILTVTVGDKDERYPIVFEPELAEAVARDMLKVIAMINPETKPE